jgi:putative addiction module component (TIGR02574 family)
MASNLQGYEELSVPEKILRLQDLWDELSTDSGDIDLTEAQRAEVARRLAAVREGTSKSAPWSEVRERIRDPK